jgi:hypothetical protein
MYFNMGRLIYVSRYFLKYLAYNDLQKHVSGMAYSKLCLHVILSRLTDGRPRIEAAPQLTNRGRRRVSRRSEKLGVASGPEPSI